VTSGGRIPRRADLRDATAPGRCMWHSRWTFGLRGVGSKFDSIAETSAAARGRWPVRPTPSGNRGHRGVTGRQGGIAERTARRKTRP
jgi:hypothetical protein